MGSSGSASAPMRPCASAPMCPCAPAPMHPCALPGRKDLARVQDAVRIEGGLDPLRERDDLGRELETDVGRLRKADAVLAADRSFQRNDASEQLADGLL